MTDWEPLVEVIADLLGRKPLETGFDSIVRQYLKNGFRPDDLKLVIDRVAYVAEPTLEDVLRQMDRLDNGERKRGAATRARQRFLNNEIKTLDDICNLTESQILRNEGFGHAILGVHRTRVSNWQRERVKGGTDGLIPQRYHPRLLNYARVHNIALEATDFLPSAPSLAPDAERAAEPDGVRS